MYHLPPISSPYTRAPPRGLGGTQHRVAITHATGCIKCWAWGASKCLNQSFNLNLSNVSLAGFDLHARHQSQQCGDWLRILTYVKTKVYCYMYFQLIPSYVDK